jgi:hypothetical protein
VFSKPVLFIIGAGSSYEIGLPLGQHLKSNIGDALEAGHGGSRPQDIQFRKELQRRFGADINGYLVAAQDLSAAMPAFVSVDEALNYSSHSFAVVELGKAMITREILAAERLSGLGTRRTADSPAIEKADASWLFEFFSMSLAGLQREDISKAFSNVTIINFNYDRSLEHYLFFALQSRGGTTADEARHAVEQLKIIRPYGSIGRLNWEQDGKVPYGAHEGGAIDIFELSSSIKTYMEKSQVDRASIATAITNSALVVILGFGFHGQSMQFLRRDPNAPVKGRTIIATVVGISPENHRSLELRLRANIVGRVDIGDVYLCPNHLPKPYPI